MVRFIEETTPFERLALLPLSFSRIDSYLACEAKYYFRYIAGEESSWGAAAALGSSIHAVLELLPSDKSFTTDDLYQLFDEVKPKFDPDNLITKELLDAGHVMMADYAIRHSEDRLEILGKELPFCIVIGSAIISGFIDRVDKLPGNVIRVTDYKSGTYEIAQKAAKDNLQLGIYALAVNKLYPGNAISAGLYYLRSGRLKHHTYTTADLEQMEQRILDITTNIIETTNYQYTNNVRACLWCDFAKTVCPVGKKRIRLKERKF